MWGHMDRDEGELATRVVMKFCPNNIEVSILFMMREPRNFISIAVHSGFTYAVGRSNHTQRLFSVDCGEERHHPQPVVHGEVNAQAQAATLSCNIYVVRGFDGVATSILLRFSVLVEGGRA